jgi:uncharacterized protein (TIGR02001 family)
MTKFAFPGLIAAGALALSAGAACAQTGPQLSYNIGVASDYVFRGVSQTDENAQLFGGVDLTAGKFYAGTWASNVDFNDSTDAEIDLYAGFKPTLGLATLDLGVIYYGYVDAPSGADYANTEFKAAASIPAGKGGLGAAVFYSPDSFGAADEATYYEINGSYPVARKWSVSGALGRQTYKGSGDYTTWNLGAAYAINDKLALDLRYVDTDEHGFGKLYDSRAVATLKAAF